MNFKISLISFACNVYVTMFFGTILVLTSDLVPHEQNIAFKRIETSRTPHLNIVLHFWRCNDYKYKYSYSTSIDKKFVETFFPKKEYAILGVGILDQKCKQRTVTAKVTSRKS